MKQWVWNVRSTVINWVYFFFCFAQILYPTKWFAVKQKRKKEISAFETRKMYKNDYKKMQGISKFLKWTEKITRKRVKKNHQDFSSVILFLFSALPFSHLNVKSWERMKTKRLIEWRCNWSFMKSKRKINLSKKFRFVRFIFEARIKIESSWQRGEPSKKSWNKLQMNFVFSLFIYFCFCLFRDRSTPTGTLNICFHTENLLPFHY